MRIEGKGERGIHLAEAILKLGQAVSHLGVDMDEMKESLSGGSMD